jgi:hypothetical protein
MFEPHQNSYWLFLGQFPAVSPDFFSVLMGFKVEFSTVNHAEAGHIFGTPDFGPSPHQNSYWLFLSQFPPVSPDSFSVLMRFKVEFSTLNHVAAGTIVGTLDFCRHYNLDDYSVSFAPFPSIPSGVLMCVLAHSIPQSLCSSCRFWMIGHFDGVDLYWLWLGHFHWFRLFPCSDVFHGLIQRTKHVELGIITAIANVLRAL